MAKSDGFGMPSQRGGEVCCGTCKFHRLLSEGAGDAGYYCDNEDNQDAYLSVTPYDYRCADYEPRAMARF